MLISQCPICGNTTPPPHIHCMNCNWYSGQLISPTIQKQQILNSIEYRYGSKFNYIIKLAELDHFIDLENKSRTKENVKSEYANGTFDYSKSDLDFIYEGIKSKSTSISIFCMNIVFENDVIDYLETNFEFNFAECKSVMQRLQSELYFSAPTSGNPSSIVLYK